MKTNYFNRIHHDTNTRLWVNNPTEEEARAAIAHHAVACTTNPTFAANRLRRDPDTTMEILDRCIREGGSDDHVVDRLQQCLALSVAAIFRPIYDASGGRDGWVSLQGNPNEDANAEILIAEARHYCGLAPNIIAKIPVTAAGLAAFEVLVAENIPIIFTEVFALGQMIAVGEQYRRISERTGLRPACYITHITGIMDECFEATAGRKKIVFPSGILEQAGLAVARRQYQVFRARGYHGTMLGGGARHMGHFTGLVGGGMHITINWSTAEEILNADPVVENLIDCKTEPAVIDELCAKLPDFRAAWFEEGLVEKDFAGYGPVQHFRNLFVKGWQEAAAVVRQRRTALKG
jgi:transaldolase